MGRSRSDADLEKIYQRELIKRIENERLPGSVVRKFSLQQGWPDLLVLYWSRWAMLEVKPYEGAAQEPNQGYWVDHFNSLSFAAFIYPENEEDVLNAMEQALRPDGAARSPLR